MSYKANKLELIDELREALETAKLYVYGYLALHDIGLGRTTTKNKMTAEEKYYELMEKGLEVVE